MAMGRKSACGWEMGNNGYPCSDLKQNSQLKVWGKV